MKQYWAYNKYKKTEYKEKQALKDLLKKQDITPEQLREAKNLQRKLFNTFEKLTTIHKFTRNLWKQQQKLLNHLFNMREWH